ncbi:LuxR C-terminal-related transcriptional regulator [Oceanobacillus sp. CAU 1775]
MVQVMIVDEQTLFREGLQVILEASEEYSVLGSFDTGRQAYQFLKESTVQPDLLLINLELENTDVIKTINLIKRKFPKTRILTLVSEMNEHFIIESILAGTNGILMKQEFTDRLIQSIENVIMGDTVLSGPVAEVLVRRIKQLSLGQKDIFLSRLFYHGYSLTNRELDIAYLLKKGYTNSEIASVLNLSEGTVKNYISEIYNKLNIRSRKRVIDLFQRMMKELDI